MTVVEGEVAGDSGGVPRDMCGWRGCGRFKFQTPLKKKLLKLKSKERRETKWRYRGVY
jgi:hypothetical protein